MYVDYRLYKACCFGTPEFFAIASFIIILLHGAWLVYVAWSRKWDWRKNGFHLFMLVGLGVVVAIQIGVLCNGGIYLREEKEVDAVEMQGEITGIKGLGQFSFPRMHSDFDEEEKTGYEFTINEIKCKFVAKGSLEVGDYVTVKYLPKSGYILYIAETDRNAVDTE